MRRIAVLPKILLLIDLKENQLTLSTQALLPRGIQQAAHLIWGRVSTPEQ